MTEFSINDEVVWQPFRFPSPSTRAMGWLGYRVPVLLDRGDHVEYTDGKQTVRLRLPDQPPTGADSFPVLARLAVVGFDTVGYALPGVKSYRVRGLDEAGRTVLRVCWTWLNGLPPPMVDDYFTDEGLRPLTDRGVVVERVTVRSEREFFDAYPDDRMSRAALSFARNPGLWTLALLAVIVVGAAVYVWVVPA